MILAVGLSCMVFIVFRYIPFITISHNLHEQVPWPDWEWLGIEKKNTDRHIERWDWMGLILLMGHAGNISHSQAYLFIYTACMGIWGEMQVEFSWVQSCRWQEQHSCGMLLFTTDYPVGSACPVFLVRQPCWTLLTSGALPSQHKWHLSQLYSHQTFFSVCLVTGPPHLILWKLFVIKGHWILWNNFLHLMR
jgi:hypothetical protein